VDEMKRESENGRITDHKNTLSKSDFEATITSKVNSPIESETNHSGPQAMICAV
jgi:hypothetical protein